MDDFALPPMPPPPEALTTSSSNSNLNSNNMSGTKCPPCERSYSVSRRHHSRKSGGNVFVLMIVATALFGFGIYLSISLPSYAPGGANANEKLFSQTQILSSALIGGGVLFLAMAWFAQ